MLQIDVFACDETAKKSLTRLGFVHFKIFILIMLPYATLKVSLWPHLKVPWFKFFIIAFENDFFHDWIFADTFVIDWEIYEYTGIILIINLKKTNIF